MERANITLKYIEYFEKTQTELDRNGEKMIYFYNK